MAGALVFGVTYHFLVPGSDNALELHNGHWESLFRTTATWLAMVEADAVRIAAELYGLDVSAESLPSERDQNFYCRAGNEQFVLKIANADETIKLSGVYRLPGDFLKAIKPARAEQDP